MTALVEIADLTCRYGSITAVRNVNMVFGDGQITAIVGPNGAGKTTLLLGIMGAVSVDRTSSIKLAGQELRGKRPHQIASLGVALVPEGRHVFPDFSVEENLRLGARRMKSSAAIAENLTTSFDLFPKLYQLRRQKAGRLSGGEQQMVAIARGLMGSPRLLLIDEMSLGLAPELALELFGALKTLANRTTVVLVDQILDLVLRTSSYAYLLRRGEIAIQGDSQVLRERTDLEMAYFG